MIFDNILLIFIPFNVIVPTMEGSRMSKLLSLSSYLL